MKKQQQKINYEALCRAVCSDSKIEYDEAVAILYNKLKRLVFVTIFKLVKDRDIAEDLAQDLWLKSFLEIRKGSLVRYDNVPGWFVKMSRNLSLDYLRKQKKMPREPLYEYTAQTSVSYTADEYIIRQEAEEQYDRIISQIPEEQRFVLERRVDPKNRISFEELSSETGLNINTLRGRMRYARVNMLKLL